MNKTNARNRGFWSKMSTYANILTYISHVRNLSTYFRSMDVIIEDEDVAVTIIWGFPNRFNHLIVVIDAIKLEAGLRLIFSRGLIQEEQILKEVERTVSCTESIHVH